MPTRWLATTAIPETTFGRYSETTPLRLAAGESLYVGNQVVLADGVVGQRYTDFNNDSATRTLYPGGQQD